MFLLKQVGWFSFDPEFHVEREQMCCYLTRTTKETHQIVIDNLEETPTYGGWVEAKGPRYCPAIEDKVLYNEPCWLVTLLHAIFFYFDYWIVNKTCNFLAKN